MKQPIHFRSDFQLTYTDRDAAGEPVDFTTVDFDIYLFADRRCRHLVASRHGQTWTNCRTAPGDTRCLQIFVDNPGLGTGPLSVEPHYYLHNPDYPDGICRTVNLVRTDVVLTLGPSDCTAATVDAQTPWQYIHDTDVYAEILRKVNAALDDILGEGGGTAAPSRKAAASSRAVRVQRGMMRTTAEPGVVYDCYKQRCGRDLYHHDTGCVLTPYIGLDEWWDYSTAFPDGMFYGQPISFDNWIEHDVENHRVKGDDSRLVVYLRLPLESEGRDTYHHYLTTDTDGRVIIAPATGTVERPVLPDDFMLKELRNGDGDWAYATATDGSRLELQWYVSRQKKRCGGGRRSYRFYDKGRFRRILRITKQNRYKGVFRVRRHTNRGYRSAWVYYTLCGDSIVRIQK